MASWPILSTQFDKLLQLFFIEGACAHRYRRGQGSPERRLAQTGRIVVAEHLQDGDGFTAIALEAHRLTGLDLAALQNPAIQPGSFRLAELLLERGIAHAGGQCVTRHAWRGHLQAYRANLKNITDAQLRTFQVADRQVLPERAGGKFPVQNA